MSILESGRYGDFALPGTEPSYAPDLSLEPVHLEVRLRFELSQATAEGFVLTTVRARREGVRSLDLNAVSLEGVEVLGVGSELSWRYDGERISLTWEQPFRRNEERRVQVHYRVQDPVTGMHFSRPEEGYPQRPLFLCTDHETERARYWLPCIDYPTVRTTFDFFLTSDQEHTILANGTLQDESDHEDGTKTAHWHLDFPCPSYLCCIAVGEFVRADDEAVEGCPIAYFAAPPFTPEHLQRSFGRTPQMLEWLQKRLGNPFPFKKYFQIALPEIGGAMENITLVTWDQVFLLDETLAREHGELVDSINIHEMAHSYFGDALVCRHFEHSWLKESWATYMETVWLEEQRGQEERDYDLYLNAERYFEESDQRYARPIVTREFSSSWDLFDMHLYPGGAWRIHMLRNIVGDEIFWQAVQDYVATYSGRVVETEDFRRKLEQHSGINLTRFFDEWLYNRGYPQLKVSFKYHRERAEGTLTIEQTQTDTKKKIGLFHFDLEILYEDEQGFHSVTVAVHDKQHTVVLDLAAPPRQIQIDPRVTTLFSLEFDPGEDLLLRSLREDGPIGVRIWAARELINTGTRANLAAVQEAMAEEPFWGVRSAVATALGKSKSAEAVQPLAALLAEEKEPRVQWAYAQACGEMRDARLRAALLKFLEQKVTYRARARALESLGRQRHGEDLAQLLAATHEQSLHGIVAGGALRGLGGLRSQETFQELLSRVVFGAEAEDSRPAAVDGLTESASWQGRELQNQALDAFIDLCRDPRGRIRMRAAAGLAKLARVEAAPALESLKKRQPAQDSSRIERWLQGLRRGRDGESLQSLRRQLEGFEERCRKLDTRVQTLEAQREGRGG